MNALATGPAPAVFLDRHQERREAGLPTISVLSGAVGLSVQLGRQWAEQRGQGMVVIAGKDSRPEAIVDAWVDAVTARHDLFQDALAWLSRRLDRPAGELGPSFGRKTISSATRSSECPCRKRRTSRPPAGGCWGNRPKRPNCRGWEPGSARRSPPATATPLPSASWPRSSRWSPTEAPRAAPGPARSGQDPTAWIAAAAVRLARLAEAEPRLPLLVAIEPEVLDCFHAMLPSRVPRR